MKKLLILLALACLSGCSAFAELAVEGALENQNNSKIRSGLQCNTMRVSCQHPHYFTEWTTPDGEQKCQCEH